MGSLSTFFAPAERAGAATLRREAALFSGRPLLSQVLDAVPDILLILNAERQIVYANAAAVEALSRGGVLVGLRPGELLDCARACQAPHGCGTTEACRTCGAARAILGAQAGRCESRDFSVLRAAGREALDLKVHSKPLRLAGMEFTVCVMVDVGEQRRREALEQLFLHDLSNSVSAVCGWAEIIREDGPRDSGALDRDLERLAAQSELILDGIQAHKQLFAAERGQLSVGREPLEALRLIEDVAGTARGWPSSRQKRIVVDAASQPARLASDGALLRRVLLNMVKNALEASAPGERVELGCGRREEEVEFWVRNPAVMTREVQLQVFQRTFSTKGTGRGLGTYGMKLLGERYLRGRVSFSSRPGLGTIFRARFPLG